MNNSTLCNLLRPIGRLLTLSLLILAGAWTANAATITWTNRLGGSWNTANNWSPHQIPTSNDAVVVTLNADVTIQLSADAAAGTLDLSGANAHVIKVNGYTLFLNGAVTMTSANSMILLDSGTLVGTPSASVNGTILWSAGTIGKTASALTLGVNGVLKADFGPGDFWSLYGRLTNSGTVQLLSGMIRVNGARVYNLPGGLVDFEDDARMDFSGSSSIVNRGTFRKSGGFGVSQIDVTFTNYGMVDVQLGTFEFSEGGSLENGSVFTGSGTNLFTDGDFAVNTSVTLPNGVLDGATLYGHGGVLGGNWTWLSGTLGQPATFLTLGAGGGMRLDFGPGNFWSLYGTLTNAGTVQLLSGMMRVNGARVYNLPGGLVDFEDDARMDFSGSSSIVNRGAFRKSGGLGVSQIDVTFTNYGTVDVQLGTFEFSEGGSLESGSVFTGSGTNLFSSGSFALNTSVTVPNGVLDGAILYGHGGVLGGNWTWLSGTLGQPATFLTLDTNGVMKLDFGTGNFWSLYGTLTNAGTVQLLSGMMRVNGARAYNLTNAWVDFKDDARMDFSGSSSIVNRGAFRKSGGLGVSQIDVTFTNYGTVDVQLGTFEFSEGGSLENGSVFTGSGTNLFTGGEFALNTSVTVPNGVLDGATLYGRGGVLGGNWTWLSGTLGKPATFLTLGAEGVMKLAFASGSFWSLYGTLTNAGTLQLLSGTMRVNGGLLNNIAGGLVDFIDDASMDDSGAPAVLNRGIFRKSGGTGTSSIGVTFTNYATVLAMTGTLSFDGTHTLASGSLMFGLNSLTDYGKINLNGSAVLAGNVSAGLYHGYIPTTGSSFPVVGMYP
jgi:hypothetical protein